jgi:hypothetical protein
MVFVNLHVGSKLKLAMLGKVNLQANDQGVRSKGIGDPVGSWETIEPKGAEIYHFDHKAVWHSLERQGVIDASHAFLQGADVPLNFGYMLIIRNCVEVRTNAGKVTVKGFFY